MNKVLIFDAYPSIRELLVEELAAEGNLVISTGNPDLIPDLITTFGPDLFVLDPYVRGVMKWGLLDSAKAKNSKLPILLFTQWSSPDPHFSEADACLPKSSALDRLTEKIRGILGKVPREGNSQTVLSPDNQMERPSET